ncbi:type II toxin-antitoxin system RelE family toxin [Aureimonas jatrophae]|uniref:mRNA interferase RelE/StbE n=1 Tax=Aureimonas jatrophae TaxID=1166073 RepID=A0A1H0CMT9_9HYPH|nr:type II toxin-antitoxin system RelE/ParE family toxin [Aureimonas jatrophae]SDN59200.1 mRNA interferase RelE/StbE [Aureimonas jatrophae]
MRELRFERQALKTLKRMPANTARTIRSKIDQYVADPASLANNVKRMQGIDDLFRLRVGDWRIIFGDDGRVVAIIRIGPRGDVYEG